MVSALVSFVIACGGGSAHPPQDASADAGADGPADDPGDRDDDGDGVIARLDCDDHDPAVYPGAPEVCDFKPNGCGANVVSEDGMVTFFPRAGASRDLTGLARSGTADQPADLDLGTTEGTLDVCAGTFFVSVLSDSLHLKLRGAGPTRTVLSGGLAARILTMAPDDATLDVAGITFQDGLSDSGGAIVGDGTLTLSDAVFTGNRADAAAPDGWGGAVLWTGTATVSNTVFSNNIGATAGGALGVQGSLDLRNCEFSSNISIAGGGVAAIDGTVTIEDVQLHDNRALQEGGAVFLQDATSTLRRVTMLRNRASVSPPTTTRAFGGSVQLIAGRATLEDSTLKDGFASIGGGGLSVLGGSDLVVRRTTFDANESLHFNANLTPDVFSGFGAGIEITDSIVRVEDSTVTHNRGRWGYGVFVLNGGSTHRVDVTFVNTVFGSNSNVLSEQTSSDVEHRAANSVQLLTLAGAVAFHCDDLGCTR
jgi:hypothetical protein